MGIKIKYNNRSQGKERKRRVEAGEQRKSTNEKTLKKCFKNNLTTIKTKISEIHRKANRRPDFLLIVKDSVHNPQNSQARTAGKYIVFTQGKIGHRFKHSKISFDKKTVFLCKNSFDYAEDIELDSSSSGSDSQCLNNDDDDDDDDDAEESLGAAEESDESFGCNIYP